MGGDLGNATVPAPPGSGAVSVGAGSGPTNSPPASSVSASSFLFLDLVGYTALTAQRGDDHAADAALALYACVRPLLAAHGAEEVKTIGDAMMLRCESPAAAVRLGLRVVGCVEAEEALPSVRVGIHTGPAVRRDRDWYGSTVNVAARLCSAAGGCEVLVSDATRLQAQRARGVEFGDPRLHWLKNVTEPVTAWVALEPPPRRAAGAVASLLRGRRRPALTERSLPRAAQRLKALGAHLSSCQRAPGLPGGSEALPGGMV